MVNNESTLTETLIDDVVLNFDVSKTRFNHMFSPNAYHLKILPCLSNILYYYSDSRIFQTILLVQNNWKTKKETQLYAKYQFIVVFKDSDHRKLSRTRNHFYTKTVSRDIQGKTDLHFSSDTSVNYLKLLQWNHQSIGFVYCLQRLFLVLYISYSANAFPEQGAPHRR